MRETKAVGIKFFLIGNANFVLLAPSIPIRYYKGCGKQLILMDSIKRFESHWYDHNTGKVEVSFIAKLRCPDYKWYRMIHDGEIEYEWYTGNTKGWR